MTLTASVRFNSDQTIEQIFRVAQEVVETPDIDNVQPKITILPDFQQIGNPPAIGAKALTWVTKGDFTAPAGQYTVCFDIPNSSPINLAELSKKLVEKLELQDFYFNCDFYDEWQHNLILE